MKKIFLTRHGETLFNLTKKRQGACDSPLTETGIDQAKKAKEYFNENEIVFDKAYCSTQERAEDTLNLITDLDYERLKELKEWNFGVYEGEPESLGAPDSDYFLTNLNFGDWWVKHGGEDVKEVRARMKNALAKIAADEGENAIVISHGGAIRSFITGIFPSEDLLENNGIERGIKNLATLEFEVLENGELKFVHLFQPLLEEKQ